MATCRIEGCGRLTKAKIQRAGMKNTDLCDPHWRRFKKYGDPLMLKRASPGDGCITEQGYRRITVDGRTMSEHRKVWQDANGPIPAKHHIHHRNRNKLDNRLSNLELRSRQEHGALHARHARRTMPGEWARKFAACLRCDMTQRRHKALGLCVNCWEIDRRRIRRERKARLQRPPPPWSRVSPSCVDCGTTAIRHGAHGLCAMCHERRRSLRRYPTRRSLAPDQWSESYAACVKCGTTERPHRGNGLCANCKMEAYRKTHDMSRKTDCEADGCGRKAWARGYCSKHLAHFVRHGDPLAGRFNHRRQNLTHSALR